MEGRRYFGNPFSFLLGPRKEHQEANAQPLTTHMSGCYQYLNCANGRLTPVNVTYDSDLHILDACPSPPKVFRLNPDAKSFVPMMNVLNPYAREFKPKCFQEENLRHKRSSCSSTHSSEEDEVSSSDDSILPPPAIFEEEECRPMIRSNRRGDFSPPRNNNPVVRVVCPERKEIIDKLKICTLGSGSSSEVEENEHNEEDPCEEDSEEEEDDWDDLEFGSPMSPSAWGDLPDEFKDNFGGLTCPLSQKPNTSRVKEFLRSAVDSDDEDSSDGAEDDEEDALREMELAERLAAINKEWSLHYHLHPSSGGPNGLKKNVSFSSENCWRVIEEDPEIAEELRESRTSDHLARKADRERIEKIISPILDQSHRNIVYSRLYLNRGDSLS